MQKKNFKNKNKLKINWKKIKHLFKKVNLNQSNTHLSEIESIPDFFNMFSLRFNTISFYV